MPLLPIFSAITFCQDLPDVEKPIRLLEDDDPVMRQTALGQLAQRWGDEGLRRRIEAIRDRARREGRLDLHASAVGLLQKLAAFDTFAKAVERGEPDLRAGAEAVPFAPEALDRISRDATRTPAVRAAALALLGFRMPDERAGELRAAFATIHERIRPMHVIRIEMYSGALDARLKSGDLKLAPEDIRHLAHIGLIEGDGLALLCLGHIQDPRSLDVLVAAGETRLGTAGDPVFVGLQRLAVSEEGACDALFEQLGRAETRSLRWMRALAALLGAGDTRVVKSVTQLLEDLADGLLSDAPCIGTGLLLSLVERCPNPEYAGPIRRWIRRGGEPLAALAEALRTCGGSVDAEDLWALIDLYPPGRNVAVAIALLAPKLQEGDAARLAKALDPSRWKAEAFYARFDLLERCDIKLLTPEVVSALWRVVEACETAFYRARALRCATRIVRPADEGRIARLVGEPGDLGLEVIRALLRRSEHPLELLLETLRSDEARRRTATTLLTGRFLSSSECRIPVTDENWASICRELLNLVDRAREEQQVLEALQGLHSALTVPPRPGFRTTNGASPPRCFDVRSNATLSRRSARW